MDDKTPTVVIDMSDQARNGLIVAHHTWFHDLEPDVHKVGSYVLATDMVDDITMPALIVEHAPDIGIYYLRIAEEDIDAAYERQRKALP